MAHPLIDLTGRRFGRLTVVRRAGTYYPPAIEGQQPTWECLCDCGNTKIVRRSGLTSGQTRSCGCLRSEIATSNGKAQRGKTWTRRKKGSFR